MSAVRKLMAEMEARGQTFFHDSNGSSFFFSGISEEEFLQLERALSEDADRALEAIRTAAITRSFDVKQAAQLVRQIGQISPFDKVPLLNCYTSISTNAKQVEAAIIMFDSLINNESFHIILDLFDSESDKENILHRLGAELDADGHVVVTRKALRK